VAISHTALSTRSRTVNASTLNGNMRMHCPPIDILKIACTQKWQAEKARSRAYWMNPGVDTRTAWEEAKIAEALAEEDLYMVRILIQQLIDAGEV
jgi:hypothetical protein